MAVNQTSATQFNGAIVSRLRNYRAQRFFEISVKIFYLTGVFLSIISRISFHLYQAYDMIKLI